MGDATTLLVWNDGRDRLRQSIRAGRIGRDGELLDGGGVTLSEAPSLETVPQVAFDGSVFVVMWTEPGRLAGTRVTPAGVVLDPRPFTIEEGSVSDVAVASDGAGRTAVVYLAAMQSQLTMRTIGSDGPVATALPVRVSTRVLRGPSVTFDRDVFLVAWTEYEPNPDHCPYFRCPPPYLTSEVLAARVTDRVLRTTTIFPSGGRSDFVSVLNVIATRDGAVLGYRHANGARDEMRFARVDAQLGVSSSQPFGETVYFPDIAVIAGVPVVSWFDVGTGIRVVPLNDDLSRSPAGAPFRVPAIWDWSAIIVPGHDFGWVLYSRRAVEEEYAGVPRTFMRQLSLTPRRARPLRR